MSEKIVTVIIPTRHRPESLIRCLKSLELQTLEPIYFEVIVVFNQTHTTCDFLHEFLSQTPLHVRVFFETRVGASFGRNKGIHESRTDILAFIDDDVTAREPWLFELIQPLISVSQSKMISSGKVHVKFPGPTPDWHPTIEEFFGGVSPNHWQHIFKSLKVIPSGNFACKRTVFEHVGGFDQHLSRIEDAEFTVRCLYYGYDIRHSVGAEVDHHIEPERASKDYIIKLAQRFGELRPHLFDRLPNEPRKYLWKWIDILGFLLAVVRASIMKPLAAMLNHDRASFAYHCKKTYGLRYLISTWRMY